MSTRCPAQVKSTPVTTEEGSPSLLAARTPAAGRALVRSAEERDRRPREDLEVEPRRAVLDVPDVQLDPVLPRERRSAVDLRPAGDAGLDLQPPPLPGRVPLDLVAERRPGTDHAHVAADDVPELGQLVDRESTEKAAGACDPWVSPVDRVA